MAQNRHGSSAAFVIPIRRSTDDLPTSRQAAGGLRDHDRPAQQVGAVVLELDAQRLRELAGPRAETLDRARARGARASASIPSSGSSALISTAAPTPSGSQTAFSSAWMP